MIKRSFPLVACLAFAVAGCGGSSATSHVTTGLNGSSLTGVNAPANIPGPLDGQITPRRLALRRPLGIIVENYDPDSRPQSGLSRASTVIETLAEGGVTRFLAIYLEHDAALIGPVRSTRVYFNNWAGAFHAILGHVGGNDDAQAALWHMPSVYNLDENHWEKNLYNTGTPLFWRSSARVAPHNLYTSTFKLRAYAAKHGQNWAYAQAYFVHKSAAALKARGHAGTIDIGFENPLFPAPEPGYAVHYQYNRKSNTYLRSMGGSRHIDALTHRQIAPANVVIMRTKSAVPDPAAGPTPESIRIPTIGRGPAWIFRDGKVVRGTWVQHDQFSPLRFVNRKGAQIALNPGQTWIEVVPPTSTTAWSFH